MLGKNGAGKTSVLQAIEWCLFGQCGYVDYAEFKREDAIVNLFNKDRKAIVILKLIGKDIVEVRRERSVGKSTTGKGLLTLTAGKENLKGEEAQERLLNLLGISVAQFHASAYLHQEAIRDFISSDAVERSKVIDELLGLYVLRELSESLPTKDVEKEIKDCEDEIEAIETATIDALELAKKKLTSYAAELQKKGYTEETLSSGHLAKLFKGVSGELLETSELMGIRIRKAEELEPDPSKLETVLLELNNNLNELDRQRFGIYKKKEQRRSKLEQLREGYVEALKELDKLGEIDTIRARMSVPS